MTQQTCPHHAQIADSLAVIRTNTEHLLAQNEAQWKRLNEIADKVQEIEVAQARRNGEAPSLADLSERVQSIEATHIHQEGQISGVRWSAGILAGIISAVISALGLFAAWRWSGK